MSIRGKLLGVLADIMDKVPCHPGDDCAFYETALGHDTLTDHVILEHHRNI